MAEEVLVPPPAQSVSFDELEWVQLRRELDDARKKDEIIPTYKKNWYVPTSAFITCCCFFYGFYHMNDMKKSTRGAYARITGQFITGCLFMYGFMNFDKNLKNKTKPDLKIK